MRKLILLSVVSFIISGCISTAPSDNSHFYRLSSPDLVSKKLIVGSTDVVVVGPVSIATYLDRSSMVNVSGANELDVSKFEQWGGGLDDEIQIALLKNLAHLDIDRVYLSYPWLANVEAKYHIRVDVLRFDSEPDHQARLEASWVLLDHANIPVAGAYYSGTAAAGSDYPQSAAALSSLLASLAKQIHQAFPKK